MKPYVKTNKNDYLDAEAIAEAPLVSTALVAAIGNGITFRKGRDLSAWIGLVPRQHSTSGKTKLLVSSKRGNPYLRRMFLHGARSVVAPEAFSAALTRQIKKQRLANPRHGFYLILRPEDQISGAPDPLDRPLMKHQGIDYRISLLRAAAFHGSSHQTAMVFQVIVPKPLRAFELGRHRLQFIYQTPAAFAKANRPEWLDSMKSNTGFARVAGIELTLLDCARYFHKAAGINGVAQIVKDTGAKADPRKLAKAAVAYENSSVRRLGYLLDRAGHARQSHALESFVRRRR